MKLIDALNSRHSVRKFINKKIDAETVEVLSAAVDKCNKESGLHIQLCLNEPKAFGGLMAKYGNFENCHNYLAMVGGKDEDEKIGYYGEQLVAIAQMLGLNSCWVGMSYDKSKAACKIEKGEKLRNAIALGYGTTQGVGHKSKPLAELGRAEGKAPDWFNKGVEYASLAPTAMNQQKFTFILNADGTVSATAGRGFYAKVDLGIAKYHFELGAGVANFKWSD